MNFVTLSAAEEICFFRFAALARIRSLLVAKRYLSGAVELFIAVRQLTKSVVDRLEPGSTVWDQEVRGFGVRRQVRDAVFVLKTRVGGRQRFITIGRHGSPWTVETARTKARSLMGAVADGRDPAGEPEARRGSLTVKNLADLFMTEHVRQKRKPTTAASYGHILDVYVVPAIGHRRASDVTHGDVAKLHSGMHQTPYQANRALAVIGAMFSWAEKRGLVPEGFNPAKRVENFREHRRERFLTTAELERLGAAIREAETVGIPWEPNPEKKVKHAPKQNRRSIISPYAAAAIRLLLFTGARLREVLHLRWKDVDLERGLLLLPDSKTGRKATVLNAPALQVLAGIERLGAYVIAGADPDQPRSDLKRSWELVSKRAGLEDVRIHDLRHSFASFGASGGAGLPIIGKLLGHTQASTTQRYAHLADDPVRRASEKIGAEIAAALGDPIPSQGVPGRAKQYYTAAFRHTGQEDENFLAGSAPLGRRLNTNR